MNIHDYYELPRINLTGLVGVKMIDDLDRQVKIAGLVRGEPGIVTLMTEGGSVGYARGIYDELRLLRKAYDLTLIARGMCISAGVTIAMAFPVENRLATRQTKFLIHEPSSTLQPAISGSLSVREMQAAIFENDFADDHNEADAVMRLIARGCQMPVRELRKQSRDGLYLKGQQAVDFGLVSGLV